MPQIIRITSASSQPLHSVAGTREIERLLAAGLPPHTLMQRAGLSVARLALALAPHAERIWIACGPGNNGGDGFEAALQLHQRGKAVVLTWSGQPDGKQPTDAAAARKRARVAGIRVAEQPPEKFDLCIDALLGIGAALDTGRAGGAQMRRWLDLMQASGKPRLCVDLPSGLNADTGDRGSTDATTLIAGSDRLTSAAAVFTLSLLTLKPGLFTAHGRDAAGEVWFDDLASGSDLAKQVPPSAWLLGADHAGLRAQAAALHASHKGSFGDVAVLGGQSTAGSHMAGAALLAARAALHAGAGRVFVALLSAPGSAGMLVDGQQPELMFRSPDQLDLKQQVIVCGCGGGDAVKAHLPRMLSSATRLVIDADALNAIAIDTQLQTQLAARHQRGYSTVLSPHPLEAARLAGSSALEVQKDRLLAARTLSERYKCVVVLKGSGSVIASPGKVSMVNASGNPLLATAGTGDVLAGMIGAFMAGGLDAFEAACGAVFAHGRLADVWLAQRPGQRLTAAALARQSLIV